MSPRMLVAVVGCVVLLAGMPVRAGAQTLDGDPDFLTFQVGGFDVIQPADPAVSFAMEYRSDERLWVFKPFGGVMGTGDGAFQIYSGLLLDVFLSRRVVFTFGFAPSLFVNSAGKDLGFPVEFRSSGELAYRFDDRSRLGLMVNHISNASLGDRNPGAEVLMLSYSIPLKW